MSETPDSTCPFCEKPIADCDCDPAITQELCEGATIDGKHYDCDWRVQKNGQGDPSEARLWESWAEAECATCGNVIGEPFPDWLNKKLGLGDWADPPERDYDYGD